MSWYEEYPADIPPEDCEYGPDGIRETSKPPAAWRRYVASAAIGTLIGVMIGETGVHLEELVVARLDRCDEPNAQDFRAVQALLDAKPHATNIHGAIETAHGLGLTTYDYVQDYKNLFDDQNPPDGFPQGDGPVGQLPVSEYIAGAKDMARRYGVQLEIPTNDANLDPQATLLDPAKLDTEPVKQFLLSFIRSLGKQPVELVHYSGLKRVELAITQPNVAGFAVLDAHTYYANPFDPMDELLFDHEESHLIDSKQCADIESDSFASIGPADTYGKDRSGGLYSYDEAGQYNQAQAQGIIVEKTEGKHSMEDYVRKANEIRYKVVTVEPYGRTNVWEDKATIDSRILNPGQGENYIDLNSREFPILHEKFLWLLARMYHYQPNVVTYLIKTHEDYFP